MAASAYVLELIGPTSSRINFENGLREMGPELAVPALIRVIEAQNSSLVRWYDYFYSKIPANMAASFPKPRDRSRITSVAVTALAQFGPEASASVPTLIRTYSYKPSQVTQTLAAIGPPASNAIPTLIHALHPTNSHCFATAAALWKIDPSGDLTAATFGKDPASSTLQAAVHAFGLQEENSPGPFIGSHSNWRALEMLGCIRSAAKQTAPVIARCLHHENERIRAKAAEALGRLGPVVQEHAKEIQPLLLDRWLMVREAATNALRRIESQHP